MESCLTKFGFSPEAEARRLNLMPQSEREAYLKQELATHELHVIRDHAVSFPYNYWLSDEGKIFTNKEHTVELELAEEERGGYYRIGIPKTLRLAKENPQQLVFFYSPIGPASFDDPPHPDYQKPYADGQLNVIYSDGDSIKNINIPLSQQGEQLWLKEVFGEEYLSYINKGGNEREKIIRFITTPKLSALTIDDFLNKNWHDPEMVVFHSNIFDKEKFFSINDIMGELRNSLLGKLKTKINVELIAQQAIKNGGSYVRPEDITEAYFTLMGSVMHQEGVDRLILHGGCGGSVVKSSDLFNYSNSVEKLMEVPNFSTTYRRQIQGSSVEDYKNDPNLCHCGQPHEPHFHCPGKNRTCHYPIIVGEGTKKCPACGLEAVCR